MGYLLGDRCSHVSDVCVGPPKRKLSGTLRRTEGYPPDIRYPEIVFTLSCRVGGSQNSNPAPAVHEAYP